MHRLRRIAFELTVVSLFVAWGAILFIESVYLRQISKLPIRGPRALASGLTLPPTLRDALWVSVERDAPGEVRSVYPWTLLWQFRPWRVELRARRVRGMTLAGLAARSALAETYHGYPQRELRLREVAATIWMSREGDTDELAAAYAARAYLGNGIYGFPQAAQRYFHAPLASLDLGQLTLLVVVSEAPERYDPWRQGTAAHSRRRHLVQRMLELGVIGVVEAEAAMRAPLPERPTPLLPSYAPQA